MILVSQLERCMPILERISLAEMSRLGGPFFQHEGQLSSDQSPTLEELTECLTFSPGDGRIWLNNQRMQLIHSSSIALFRSELIDSFGIQRARGILTRTGYASGSRDAALVRERWPDAELPAIFAAGTKLHALEGVVQVEPVHFEYDSQKGLYEGEFIWRHSSEDEQHITTYGIGTDPSCWMELGYAMGYVSGLVGSLVIFREVECRSLGHSICRVIGKSAELWDDIEEDLQYLNASNTNIHSSALQSSGPERSADRVSDFESSSTESQMIGVSAAFTAASHSLKKVAGTQATVLLTGESGVGKELFATSLHHFSQRKEKPFVAFNCAAIPEQLMEAELFGVEKGAYTGATKSRAGRFERAEGGTLFLDEIGTLSLEGQSKLLRALQEKVIERVGGTESIVVNVRIVAATNLDLRKAVESGDFRDDLFYRLNVFPIKLPPLRERRNDIPLLVNHFFQYYCREHQRNLLGITQKATNALLNYDFPGNIRELQNIIERGVIDADEGQAVDLPNLFRNEPIPKSVLYSVNSVGTLSNQNSLSTNEITNQFSKFLANSEGISIDEVQLKILNEVVAEAKGNLSEAARRVGLTRAQLAYRLKKNYADKE